MSKRFAYVSSTIFHAVPLFVRFARKIENKKPVLNVLIYLYVWRANRDRLINMRLGGMMRGWDGGGRSVRIDRHFWRLFGDLEEIELFPPLTVKSGREKASRGCFEGSRQSRNPIRFRFVLNRRS